MARSSKPPSVNRADRALRVPPPLPPTSGMAARTERSSEIDAVDVYRKVQATAWREVRRAEQAGRSAARPLAEIRQAQREIDARQREAELDGETAFAAARRFQETVVQLITENAPELAPELAAALLEAAAGEPSDDAPDEPPMSFTNPYAIADDERSDDESEEATTAQDQRQG